MQQIKKPIITLNIITILLSIIPYIATFIAHPHAGIGVIATAWLILYPIYFALVGIVLAKYSDVKWVWLIPTFYIILTFVTNALVTSYDIWVYFAGYMVINYFTMGITVLIQKSKEGNLQAYIKAKKTAIITFILVAIALLLLLISMLIV